MNPVNTRILPILQTLTFCLIGMVVGVVSWGEFSSPAVSLAIPLAWALASSRLNAVAVVFCYQLAVMRFLPPFAAVWFESMATGVLAWLLQASMASITWAICWPKRRTPVFIALMTFVVLIATLVLPWSLVSQTGHPLVGFGFLAPGTAWLGVIAFFTLLPAGAAMLTKAAQGPGWKRLNGPVLASICSVALGCMFLLLGDKLKAAEEGRGRIAGRIGAVHTEWGRFPKSNLEVVNRIERIGKTVKALAGGQDGFDTVIFPESIIGLYEPGTSAVIKSEVLRDSEPAGQTVVIGADIQIGQGRFQNAAVVFRPDHTTSYITARQTPPFAGWAPWSHDEHFPADWFGNSTANIGGGVRARFMFCFEEYVPALHLLSELREEQNLIVAMSNGWASRNPLSSAIQSGHTEGMAKLFGRNWVRAENGSIPLAKAEVSRPTTP